MAPQAATKAEQLDQRMLELVQQDAVSTFEIAQLCREANSILSAHPGSAHMVLGYLSALDGDESETRSHFKTAIRLSPRHVVHSNFAQSLRRLNLYSDALREAHNAYQEAPGNLRVLDDLIAHALYAGTFLEAKALLESRTQLHPDHPLKHEDFIVSVSAMMRENQVSDSDVSHLQELVTSVLRMNGVFARGANFLLQEDEESKWASVWLRLKAPVETVVDLNIELCNRLAAIDPPITTDRTVGYLFVSAEDS